MTQEEKQLLLKDLCARLPYGVKLGFENSDLILVPKEFNIYTMHLSTNQIYPKSDSIVIGHVYDVWNYRPYLRPMSSMTEEEKKEYNKQIDIDLNKIAEQIKEEFDTRTFCPENVLLPQYNHVDWLNKNMFDYRGLIPMRLALEAPEDMYKIK